MKELALVLLGVFLTLGSLEGTFALKPSVAPTWDPVARHLRQTAYQDELAKIPETRGVCESIRREIYVETNGKKAIWHGLCAETPFIIGFWFDENGKVVRVVPEGEFQE